MPTNTNNTLHSSTNHHVKITSLNCRSLIKTNNPQTSSDFIRYLRQLKDDILCLQETHASTFEQQHSLNIKFCTENTIWTKHCGIVSFNPAITLIPHLITLDQRLIACQVTHINNIFPPFLLINIYAPADERQRRAFYNTILQLPPLLPSISASMNEEYTASRPTSEFPPMIILGDFNYHVLQYAANATNPITNSAISPQQQWHNLMSLYFQECSQPSNESASLLPTFRRGDQQSTIDYMYASPLLRHYFHSSFIEFINTTWTDHALLCATFNFPSSNQGFGIWRAHPRLAINTHFQKALTDALDLFHSHLENCPPDNTPQQQWDGIKALVRDIAQKTGRRKQSAHQRMLKRLQGKRNKLLRRFKLSQILPLRLATIEKQIGLIQQEVADSHALRAGQHWQENGEKSAGFLKKTIEQRSIRRNIPSLRHPTTNQLCSSNFELQSATTDFYTSLYTPSPINSFAISTLAATIPNEAQIPPEKHFSLTKPFSLKDIEAQTTRSPKKSSPGKDGIPYEILHLLLQHPPTARLALTIFNDALTNQKFPDSWLQTCVCLLPKKGDLTDLRNWRPISLINTDAKVFTRLIKDRLMDQLSSCISPHQSGFMPNRFIANHGLTLHVTKMIATHQHSSSIALLLDQEKAYDRVHSDYLASIMHKFGIPTQLINCIRSLFFSTNIAFNVNGHITSSPVSQLRGLRQGDPLSPLLFNIAFDPFLRLIAQDPDFKGFQFTEEAPAHDPPTDFLDDLASAFDQLYVSPPSLTSLEDLTCQFTALFPFQDDNLDEPPPSSPFAHSNPLAVKILAYADDTLVFLSNHNDFHRLQQAINIYSSASNAHLNIHKTEATSLSGLPLPQWQSFLPQHNITTWHDRRSPSPFTYLGYPICSSTTQRSVAFQHILTTVTNACNIHSQRQLSIRGRATVLNTLIYSKLWHVLRLTSFTKAQLQQITSIGSAFINRNIFPRISISALQLPRHQGGLGILDLTTQQQALQWRWLSPVLQSDTPNSSPNGLSFLRYSLQWFFHSEFFPSYRFYFLFPHCRQSIFFPFRFSSNALYLNIFHSFTQAIDSLFHPIEDCHIDPFTCLSLPLLTAIKTAATVPPSGVISPGISIEQILSRHPGFRKLLCSDVFTFDFTTLQLRLRSAPFTNVRHPTLSQAAVTMIQTNQVSLHSFFNYNCQLAPRHQPPPDLTLQQRINLTPFVFQLIQPSPTKLDLSSTKHYKSLLAPHIINIPAALSPTQWKSFWSLNIPLPSRTIWFRLLHKKISCKQTLHKIIPLQHPSPNCPLCLNNQSLTEESIEHMLFLCPAKRSIWLEILSFYINNSIQHIPDDIIHILRTVSNFTHSSSFRDPSLPYASLSFEQIFACALQGIWQSHWSFIFNATVFSPSATISKIHSFINKLYSQNNYIDSIQQT